MLPPDIDLGLQVFCLRDVFENFLEFEDIFEKGVKGLSLVLAREPDPAEHGVAAVELFCHGVLVGAPALVLLERLFDGGRQGDGVFFLVET